MDIDWDLHGTVKKKLFLIKMILKLRIVQKCNVRNATGEQKMRLWG